MGILLNDHSQVLVVYDDPFIRGLLAAWLQEAGYGVVVAADGQQALAQIRREIPDILLLDLSMPILDGYGVVRWLRQQRECRALPILILSADVWAPKKLTGLQVEGFLSKPFDLDEVLALVRAYVPPEKLPAAV